MGKRNSRKARKHQKHLQAAPPSPHAVPGDADRRTSPIATALPAEPPKPAVHPGGRPRIDIDLDELKRLMTLQCTREEVAAFFKVSLSTVDKRLAEDGEFKQAFSDGDALGRISIRRKQMQLLENGNATMAVWLGKNRLGQRDNMEHTGDQRSPLGMTLDQYRALWKEEDPEHAS